MLLCCPLTAWTTGGGLKSFNMSLVGSSLRLWWGTGATGATGGWFSKGGRKGVGNFFGGVRTAESDKEMHRSSSPFPAHATLASPVSWTHCCELIRKRQREGRYKRRRYIQCTLEVRNFSFSPQQYRSPRASTASPSCCLVAKISFLSSSFTSTGGESPPSSEGCLQVKTNACAAASIVLPTKQS